MGALRLIGPEGRSPSGQCAVHSRVRVHLPELVAHPPLPPGLTRSWAVLHLQLRSPRGASAARPLGIGCRPQGDVGTGGQFAAVTLESGRCLPPREGRGTRGVFSRLPASARWIGQAPGPGLPAWAAPSRTSKRGCAVRSGLSQGPGQVAGEHSFCTGSWRGLRESTTTAGLHWRL